MQNYDHAITGANGSGLRPVENSQVVRAIVPIHVRTGPNDDAVVPLLQVEHRPSHPRNPQRSCGNRTS